MEIPKLSQQFLENYKVVDISQTPDIQVGDYIRVKNNWVDYLMVVHNITNIKYRCLNHHDRVVELGYTNGQLHLLPEVINSVTTFRVYRKVGTKKRVHNKIQTIVAAEKLGVRKRFNG